MTAGRITLIGIRPDESPRGRLNDFEFVVQRIREGVTRDGRKILGIEFQAHERDWNEVDKVLASRQLTLSIAHESHFVQQGDRSPYLAFGDSPRWYSLELIEVTADAA